MWGPLCLPGLGLRRAMWHVGDTSACSQLLCATLQPHLYQLREPFVHTILPMVLYLGYLLFKRELTYFFLSGPFTHPQFALAKTVWWVRGRNPSIPVECRARPPSSTRYHVSKHLRNEDNSIPSFQPRTQFILQRQLGMNETFSQESGSGFLKLGELRQATSPRTALRFYIQTWVCQCFLTLAAHQTHTYLCVSAKLLQSCLTLCDYMDHSPSGSSIPGILQARILEWVAMPTSRGSFWARDWTMSLMSCSGRQILYHSCYMGRPIHTCRYSYTYIKTLWYEQCNEYGDEQDTTSGEGNGTLLQNSCLETPMDEGAW